MTGSGMIPLARSAGSARKGAVDGMRWTEGRRGARLVGRAARAGLAAAIALGLGAPARTSAAQAEGCSATLARGFLSPGGDRFHADWDDEVEVELRIVVNCVAAGLDVQSIDVQEVLPAGFEFSPGEPFPADGAPDRPRWRIAPEEVGPLVEVGLWYTVRVRPSGLPQSAAGEVRLTWPSVLAATVGGRVIALETAAQPALRIRARRVDAGCRLVARRAWLPSSAEPGRPISSTLEIGAEGCAPFRARPEMVLALQPPESRDTLTRTLTLADAFADAIEPAGGLFGIALNARSGARTSPPARGASDALDLVRSAVPGEGGDSAAALSAALAALDQAALHHALVIHLARPTTPRADPTDLAAVMDDAARRGVEVVTVCIGDGTCDPALRWDRTYSSLTAARFDVIGLGFERHFGPTLSLVGVEVAETVPEGMRPVPDSASPPAALAGDELTWPLVPLAAGAAPATLRHALVADRALGARYEGRGRATLVYSDGGAGRHRSEPLALPRAPVRVGVDGERGACAPLVDKTVYPPAIVLGEQVEVRLDLSTTCSGLARRSDVILALDVSGSMTVEKMADLKSAGRRLTEQLDGTAARLGIVTFNESIRSLVPLSHDVSHVLRAIDAAGGPDGAGFGFTDVAVGLDASRLELEHRRRDADASVVLMSDGETTPDAMLAAAARLRAERVEVFTVCFGAACPDSLAQTATSPDHYFEVLDGEALDRLLATLGARLGEVGLESARIEDVLGPDVRLVPGSARPAPEGGEGSAMEWRLEGDDLAFVARVRYLVEPLRIGSVPANVRAHADVVDTLGRAARADFPVPLVEVLQPGDEGPCEPTLTQSGPSVAVLGDALAKRLEIALACPGREAPLDVILAIDHSDSMRFEGRLDNAVAAATAFLDDVAAADSRIGLVAFATDVSASLPLAGDQAAVRAALSRLAPGGRTSIGAALAEAERRFGDRRPAALAVLVLLTDGREAPGGAAAMLDRADRLKAAGIGIVTVCAGDCDPELALVASRPSHAFDAGDREALIDLFRDLAHEFSNPRPANVRIRDALPAALRPVDGGSTPRPDAIATPQVEWRLPELPEAGIGIDAAVLAVEPGRHPLSRFARVDYEYGFARVGRAYFPAPEIDIVTPTPSPVPTRLPTRIPSPTRTPWPSATPSEGSRTPAAPSPSATAGEGPWRAYAPWAGNGSGAEAGAGTGEG